MMIGPESTMIEGHDRLNPREWLILALLTILTAASRLLARAKTLWDWDEAQFVLAVADYDVVHHQPHPPGFPGFILVARALERITGDEFSALQLIVLAGASLLFPAVFALARSLGFRFVPALSAGLLCAFFPNVWLYGGTAFSDVPAIALSVLAVAMFLSTAGNRWWWIGACAVGAVAISFRPQNLLLFIIAALIAMVSLARVREWFVLLLGAASAAAIAGGAYGFAIVSSGGIEPYLVAVDQHSDYISRIDSFRSPDRPPMLELVDNFWVNHYAAGSTDWLLTLLVLVGLVSGLWHRDRRVLIPLATFGPVALIAIVTLDYLSRTRFAIGYIPLFALLAAYGLQQLADLTKRWSARLQLGITSAIVALMIYWTWPALTVVRTTASPPAAAAEWAASQAAPGQPVYAGFSMLPLTRALFLGTGREVLAEEAIWSDEARSGPVITEGRSAVPGSVVFVRARYRLWNIARRRYFLVSVSPNGGPAFESGWYGAESDSVAAWRWMSAHAIATLPPLNGPCRLDAELEPVTGATVAARLDGDPVPVSQESDRARVLWSGDCAPGSKHELELRVDRTIVPADRGVPDTRRLGARLVSLRWSTGERAAASSRARP